MSKHDSGITELIVEAVIVIICIAVIWSGVSYIFFNN